MPERLRHITSIPVFKPATPVELVHYDILSKPDLGDILPPSFLRETVTAPFAANVLKPCIEQAQNTLRKTAFRTLTRSKKDYLPTYHSRRGRRPRSVCPKCNRSYRRSEGHQCRGETQKFNLFPTGFLKKAA